MRINISVKDEDGLFRAFVVDGDFYEECISDLNKLKDQVLASCGVFEKIDLRDIDGTALIEPIWRQTLENFSNNLLKTVSEMEKHRLKQCDKG